MVAGNVRPAVMTKHACDLGKRKASRLTEFDKGKLQENIAIELPPQPMPAEGADQADLLIVAQRRGRYARSFCNLPNIQNLHA
jgi:hypothetical protein